MHTNAKLAAIDKLYMVIWYSGEAPQIGITEGSIVACAISDDWSGQMEDGSGDSIDIVELNLSTMDVLTHNVY